MKKYSIEAEDLLSEFELFEIKGGGEPDTGDGIIRISIAPMPMLSRQRKRYD